jgi:hypothetical protein
MHDPEMCFELRDGQLDPYYYRNDYVGVEQWSRHLVGGQYVQLANLVFHRTLASSRYSKGTAGHHSILA